MCAGYGRNFQVVGQSGAVRSGAREWVLLAAVRIGVDQREHSIQIGVAQLAELLHQTLVVNREHGHMISGIVAHLGTLDAQLNVHAGAATALVQLAVHLDGGQEWVLGVEGRALVLNRVQAGDLSRVNAVRLHIWLF